MMNYRIAQTLSRAKFKRRFGIHCQTFNQMLKALQPVCRIVPCVEVTLMKSGGFRLLSKKQLA